MNMSHVMHPVMHCVDMSPKVGYRGRGETPPFAHGGGDQGQEWDHDDGGVGAAGLYHI